MRVTSKEILLLPNFWMYIISFLILHLGSHISLLSYNAVTVSDFFLPTALSIILINWIGPKQVLPVVYFNAFASSYLWGNPVESWPFWFIYALPETLFAFLSWYLFRKISKGKFWLPDINNTLKFMLLGVLIPAIIESLLLQWILIEFGNLSFDTYWSYVLSNVLSEFSTSFFLTLPALYYLSPIVLPKERMFLADSKLNSLPQFSISNLIELLVIYLILLAITFFIEFKTFWYIYGVFPLYIAIRFGFGPAILTNLYILILIYGIPKFFNRLGVNFVGDYLDVINIFLGTNFLFVFASVTGRVISDLKEAKSVLMKQNYDLDQSNKEIDKFVYSLSHDLSAPLKSIQGIVNLSKLTDDYEELASYFDKIEFCVEKEETFISEIQDYFINKRSSLELEEFDLEEVCNEVIENMQYTPGSNNLKIYFELEEKEMYTDKRRIKIILNSLISNAIIFQKQTPKNEAYLKIKTTSSNGNYCIIVEDNGEGIKQSQINNVFEMFYRGNAKSKGSGLGLYIAKETVAKLGGEIGVESIPGSGTTFTINLKDFRKIN